MRLDSEYSVEIKKLANGLIDKGIKFVVHQLFDGYQIVVYEDDKQVWDAICHSGSYGHEQGLLEIAGSIVRDDCLDTVEANLTAEDILARL